MDGKIFLIVTLLACASVQLVNSIECLTCSDLNSCAKPISVKCNASVANNTRDILNRYYYDVQIINGIDRDLSCFVASYREKNFTALQVAGCIMPGTVSCESHPIDESLIEDKCDVCQWDNCNSFENEVPSLECYTCFGATECKFPKKVGCNFKAASHMREMLKRYYNYEDINGYYGTYNYNCFVGRYGPGNQTEVDIRGCMEQGTIQCDARLMEYRRLQYCSVCNTNLCNTKSVAAISSSIGKTIVLLVIAKIYITINLF